MSSMTTSFDQTQQLAVQATASGNNRRKKFCAGVCGVLQICTGLMGFTVGVIESSTRILTFGVPAYIGAIITVLAGAFGIQYGRTGGKCPAITSMVFSILGSIEYGSVVFLYSFLMAISIPNNKKSGMSPNGINNVWENADACAGLILSNSIINFIACIVQSACACGMVCSCCKPTNTTRYITNPEFLQKP